MSLSENTYISGGDTISYEGVLRGIPKSGIVLQPIFEAFTNAVEAIKDKQAIKNDLVGEINIKIYQSELTDGSTEFVRFIIEDNGKGFDDLEFGRFNRYKDFSKGYKNLGSGRLQYAHFFNSTLIQSTIFQDDTFLKREFLISKDDEFVKSNNAITKHLKTEPTSIKETGTKVTFTELLDKKHWTYHTIDNFSLKKQLIERYLQYLCINKDILPNISIYHYIQGELKGTSKIEPKDIPNVDKETDLDLNYFHNNGAEMIQTEKTETFIIKSYKASKSVLNGNRIKLTSKNEIIEGVDIELNSLSKNDVLEGGDQFLFLISSEYIDDRDTDIRGNIQIPDKKELSKSQLSMYTRDEIFLEDIEAGVNHSINSLYPEFEVTKQKHQKNLDKLKSMFLLDESISEEIAVSLNDSENKILEKFYSYEAKKTAKLDATIKERIDHLDELDTTSEDYTEVLQREVELLSKAIPQQNKAALTKYVARRKLVLELFQKIIDKQLIRQIQADRNLDEKLLHNLIFQQSNSNPNQSDLWLINEEFIYFKGTSEDRLTDIKIDNVNLLRGDLTAEEEEYRKSLDEDRYTKRPDILLFPEESKCIIIEFKNPSVNVSDHLLQINNYAALIWNFAKPEHQFTTFYGYLIGEKMSNMDIKSKDSDFKEAYGFDYMFRPHKSVPGFFSKERNDASLYTEVIKYSTLLERAKRRNQIFIDKLTSPIENIEE